MPRKPKSDHQIRRLRKIIGKSQRGFARMIGISVSALQRIELGTLKLSPAVVSRISAVTDVEAKCLNRIGPIKHASGENYTREHFERSQRRLRSRAINHECEYLTEELCDRIRILLQAALKGKRFSLVASDLWTATEKLRKTYGLERLTNELLHNSPRGPREEWSSIAPVKKIVFFDDDGHQLFSTSDRLPFIASRLSIAPKSLAYGLDNMGFLIEVAHSMPSENLAAQEQKRGLAPHRLTKPLSARPCEKRKKA